MDTRTRVRAIALLVCLASLLPAVDALAPSEVLFNPSGNDNGLEFIELVGDENLTLCTVRDTSSADALELLRVDDSDVILIVESDGAYANVTGATVYGAGAAIGNGLGNTAETITISCEGTVLLSIAYNTSLLPDVPDGASIVWRDDAWVAGTVGGTPGVTQETPLPPTTEEETTTAPPPTPALTDVCNTTLLITMSTTNGEPDDTVVFTVVSPEYASWEALTDDGILAYGDTVTSRTHAITLPHDTNEVRVIAQSRACGGRQRATRYVAVASPPPDENVTAVTAVAVAASGPREAVMATEPSVVPIEPAEADVLVTPVTGNVIVDEDRDAVPWIAGFGIVTVLASVAVFIVVHKREDETKTTDRGGTARDQSHRAHSGLAIARRARGSAGFQGDPRRAAGRGYPREDGEAKYLRTRWARKHDGNSDGEGSERAPQEGMDPGRRDV